MSKRGHHMTLADIIAHQEKHFGKVPAILLGRDEPEKVQVLAEPKRRKKTKVEEAMELILQAQIRRGEVLWYAYEPITLRWGYDEETGERMSYKPDFLYRLAPVDPSEQDDGYDPKPVVLEVKGGKVWDRDVVRFKGCRAEWNWLFDFVMLQKKGTEWLRLH